MLAQANAVVYTSRREQELAERAFSWLSHGVVVAPGVDGPASVAGANRPPAVESPYVLVLSRLAASKRIDIIIRAFHQVVDLIPDRAWRLVIAGDGDPAVVEYLHQMAADGRAASRIEFRGWVAGAQKQALLAAASLLAAPSHQESFGLSLVEAMAFGVPVLTSTEVDLAADIETARAGWVVPADVAATARALGDVLSRPEDRHLRGAAARQLAAGYDWPASIRRLQDVYSLVLDRVVEPLPGVVTS
jgi:D-inositol-3-phosphate glycosyltransferase